MSSFESSLEDFFSVCDQIEANLKTALEIHAQSSASLRYMTIPPVPNKVDLSGAGPGANSDGLSYQQYLQTAKQQAHFTSETRNQLIKAAADSSDMVKQQQQQQQQQQ